MITRLQSVKGTSVLCLTVICFSLMAAPAEEKVNDTLFFFIEKINHYQQSEAGELTIKDYGFVASLFRSGVGRIKSASVSLPGKMGEFAYEDIGRMYVFQKGHYDSIQALNAEFPDGEYYISIKSQSNNIVDQPLNLLGKGRAEDYPPAPAVELTQNGMKVGWSQIDSAKDLRLSWTPFSTGKVDPKGILDDVIVVLTDDCKGNVVDSSGLPFTDRYLTFLDDSYTIKAGSLKPGVPYAFRVEHIRHTDTVRNNNVPGLAVYAAITIVQINTIGKAVDTTCST